MVPSLMQLTSRAPDVNAEQPQRCSNEALCDTVKPEQMLNEKVT